MSQNAQYIAYQTATESKACTLDSSSFSVNCYLSETGATEPAIANDGSLTFQKNGELLWYNHSDASYHVVAEGAQNQNISANGEYIVFATSEQLAPTDTNGLLDVYLYSTTTGTIEHISLHAGVQSNSDIGDKSHIAISDNGLVIAAHGHSINWFGNIDNNAQVFYFSNLSVCPPPVDPVTSCGDGIRTAEEQCDDGNTDDKDSCSNSCTINLPDSLKECSWNPVGYNIADPLTKIGTFGKWFDYTSVSW